MERLGKLFLFRIWESLPVKTRTFIDVYDTLTFAYQIEDCKLQIVYCLGSSRNGCSLLLLYALNYEGFQILQTLQLVRVPSESVSRTNLPNRMGFRCAGAEALGCTINSGHTQPPFLLQASSPPSRPPMPLTQAPAPSFQSAIVLTLPLRRTITYGSKLCKIKHLHGYPFPTSYIKIFNLMQQNSMSSEKTLFLPLYLPVPQRANHTMQCPTLPLRRCTITLCNIIMDEPFAKCISEDVDFQTRKCLQHLPNTHVSP